MTPVEKPFSQACENNKEPILAILKTAFAGSTRVLEIGSGTGQHAVHFAGNLPHLHWQTSDLPENHAGIEQWLLDASLSNLSAPVALDVSQQAWPVGFDAVFTANTTHIMPWPAVVEMIARIGSRLPAGGVFCQYGPFKYNGDYTSPSNASFDRWLKEIDPARGIRDFEALRELADHAGLSLVEDHAMPANNQLLHWVKRG
ncbi:DUF938 domain-containing protein [Marinobacterium litorale]|uniref:DUF938 domain-containing protein n=1 Tax=Marinobacterium litorale TaxID=404770 RepID=UPI000428E0EC|nr:DUF938 domain-containing protein [Marinobacterium litorale]